MTKEELLPLLEQIRDEQGLKANTATRVGTALIALMNALVSPDELPDPGDGGVPDLQAVSDAGNVTDKVLVNGGILINSDAIGVRFNLGEDTKFASTGYCANMIFNKVTGELLFETSYNSGDLGEDPSYITPNLIILTGGGIKLGNYGTGSFLGTVAKILGVDNEGNVIEAVLNLQAVTDKGFYTTNPLFSISGIAVVDTIPDEGASTPIAALSVSTTGENKGGEVVLKSLNTEFNTTVSSNDDLSVSNFLKLPSGDGILVKSFNSIVPDSTGNLEVNLQGDQYFTTTTEDYLNCSNGSVDTAFYTVVNKVAQVKIGGNILVGAAGESYLVVPLPIPMLPSSDGSLLGTGIVKVGNESIYVTGMVLSANGGTTAKLEFKYPGSGDSASPFVMMFTYRISF